MRKNKGIACLAIFFLFCCLSFCPVSAQEIEFASSPNPVGSGARALGMGGAFIAVADDATAASWNPGGLIQLEQPEISIVGAGFYRSEDNTFGGHSEADGDQSVTEWNLNYLSAAYPFTLAERNMIVALTYQYLYDFNRSWQMRYWFDQNKVFLDMDVDYKQEGGLSAVGLSYAVQVIPTLSLGLTMNIWDDAFGTNSWDQSTSFVAVGRVRSNIIGEVYRNLDEYSFSGMNFNFGFLWRITEALTLGGVYKTPFTADVEHTATLDQLIVNLRKLYLHRSVVGERSENETYDEEMDMPASYGLGVAYRFSDSLTASFDLYRTEWDDMIYTDYRGTETSAISGREESESDIEPTIQARAGFEYLIIKPKYVVPLRAGIFYDPAPSEGTTDEFYGIALGSGFAMGRYIFDVGYQYRFGSNVGSAIYKGGDLSQDVREHTLYTSLIVHF